MRIALCANGHQYERTRETRWLRDTPEPGLQTRQRLLHCRHCGLQRWSTDWYTQLTPVIRMDEEQAVSEDLVTLGEWMARIINRYAGGNREYHACQACGAYLGKYGGEGEHEAGCHYAQIVAECRRLGLLPANRDDDEEPE
jgi:hypothetical protein